MICRKRRKKNAKGRWTERKERREKRGVQERGRAKAFKRLLVTKLMGSLYSSFLSFIHTLLLHTLSLRTSFCPQWREEEEEECRERGQRKANMLISIITRVCSFDSSLICGTTVGGRFLQKWWQVVERVDEWGGKRTRLSLPHSHKSVWAFL